MSFFEDLPDLPHPPRPAREPRMGASNAEAPVGVPLSLVVGRSERAAVIAGPLQVFSDGFEIDVNLVMRAEPDDGLHPFDPFSRHHGQPKDRIVRLAFVFADGSRADALRAWDEGRERVLLPQGGGGGSGRWSTSFWSWPLPPPGAVEVVCAWPAYDVAETRTSFDAQAVLDAAARVERLWPEPEDEGGSGSWTSYIASS